MIAVVLAAVLVAGLPQERHIGFVLSLAGSWTVDGRTVTQGQAVPPGGRVRLTGPPTATGTSSITIVLLNNQAFHVRCDATRACEQDHLLPASLLTRQSLAGRLTDAALALFGQRPARYVPTMSRGVAASSVEDAIVELSDGTLDMRPCLARLESGRYLLRLAPLAGNTGRDTGAVQFEVLWSREQPASIAAEGMQEGLFEVTVISRAIRPTPDAVAWVLIRSGARYREAVSDYRVVEAAVQQWDPDVPQPVRRSFLRASLDGLAVRDK